MSLMTFIVTNRNKRNQERWTQKCTIHQPWPVLKMYLFRDCHFSPECHSVQTNKQKRKWRRDEAGERKERKRKKKGRVGGSVMKTEEFSSPLAILQIMTRWGKSVSQVGRSGAGADGLSWTSWTVKGKNSLFIPFLQLVTHPVAPHLRFKRATTRQIMENSSKRSNPMKVAREENAARRLGLFDPSRRRGEKTRRMQTGRPRDRQVGWLMVT